VVAPKVVGAYVGGFGTGPGLKTRQAKAYEAIMKKHYPKLPAADGFVYNYYNAAWALIRGLQASNGEVGAALQRSMPKTNKSGYEVSDGGVVKLDARRQAIQDQYPLQIVRQGNAITTAVVGYVPNVDQSFGGLFKPSSPAPGRAQPKCVKKSLPWQGKIKVVRNGVITNQTIR
jgi:branched-chain amino acid transport system substrate-binding protein